MGCFRAMLPVPQFPQIQKLPAKGYTNTLDSLALIQMYLAWPCVSPKIWPRPLCLPGEVWWPSWTGQTGDRVSV